MAINGADIFTIVLTSVFLVALLMKLGEWESTVEWITLLRMPQPARLAMMAIGSEIAVIAALVSIPRFGAFAALIWLLLVTAVLFRARQLGLGCACFGRREAANRTVFARNGVLAAIAVGITFTPAANSSASVLFASSLVPVVAAVVVIVWKT